MPKKSNGKAPARRRRTPQPAPATALTADEIEDAAESVLRAKKRAHQRALRGH